MSSGWTEEQVEGHLCDVFTPDEPNDHGYVVIYLHGVHLGRLTDKPAFNEQFRKYGLPVVAPMTQRSWWTDRICEEFDAKVSAEEHLLQRVLPFVEQRFGATPPRIALLGTSMGGQGALRFAYKHPDTFPVVAAISPAIDYQLRIRDGDEVLSGMYVNEEEARQDTALLHVHPLNWPRHQFFCCDPEDHRWWDSAERLRMKLYSLGVPHEYDMDSSAGGHGFDYYNHMAEKTVNFLADALDKERRRLV